jgi:hypothetical protein
MGHPTLFRDARITTCILATLVCESHGVPTCSQVSGSERIAAQVSGLQMSGSQVSGSQVSSVWITGVWITGIWITGVWIKGSQVSGLKDHRITGVWIRTDRLPAHRCLDQKHSMQKRSFREWLGGKQPDDSGPLQAMRSADKKLR